MSINARFLKIVALLARIILLIIFVPLCLFCLITLTFPLWAPSLIAELPEEYQIKAEGYHSLSVLWQGQTPVLDRLSITLPDQYHISITDFHLSPRALHLGSLKLTQLPTQPSSQQITDSAQTGHNLIAEWRPYLLPMIDFLPRHLQIDKLSLENTPSDRPTYPVTAFSLTLDQIDWQQHDISLKGQVSLGVWQTEQPIIPILQADFSTLFSLQNGPFKSDVSGKIKLSNKIIARLNSDFPAIGLNKTSLNFRPDHTELSLPFDLSVDMTDLGTGIMLTSQFDLSPLSDLILPDHTKITLLEQSSKPNFSISAHYQTALPRPKLNLSWQNIALQIQQQTFSEKINLNGSLSLKPDHPDLALNSKLWFENYSLAVQLDATTQIEDLKTLPPKIALKWRLPRFSSLMGQTDLLLSEQKKKILLTSKTKASQIDLRELRQAITLFNPTLFPRELIDADGSLNLSLSSKLAPKMTHQGRIKLMAQEILYKNTKSFEARVAQLAADFDFSIDKTQAHIKTRKDLNISQIRVKSEQKEINTQPEQVFNNLIIAGKLQHHFPDKIKIDLQHFSTNWLEGALSLKPTTFQPDQKAYAFTIKGQKLNLAKLAKYWQISGLEIDGRLDGDIPVTYYPKTKSIRIGNGFLKSSRPGIIAYKPGSQSVTHQTLSQYGQIVEQALENFHFKILQASLQRDQNDELSILLKLQGRNPDLHNGRPINFNLSLSGDLEKIVQQSLAILYFPQSLSERLRLDKIKKHTRP